MTTHAITSFSTEIEKLYFSPILLLQYDQDIGPYFNTYCFIGKGDPWPDEENPPDIEYSQVYLKNVYKNLIAIKKINVNDISPVIERIDWKENYYYDIYSDTTNLFLRDNNGKLIRKFYIRNKYDQVFKCLWNNINVSNTYNITNIIDNNTYKTVYHDGGTFDIGSFISIFKVIPTDYNGTYKVIDSTLGEVKIINTYETEELISENNNTIFTEDGIEFLTGDIPSYNSGGLIKYSELTVEEPMFDVGTFDENKIVTTADGYKWKYLYTIDPGMKLKFFDEEWMPIPVFVKNYNPLLTSSKGGSIDTINIVNPGNDYTDGVDTCVVNITGDGNNAKAQVYVSSNTVSNILMVNNGENYTYANTTLVPASGFFGSGAELSFTISPIGGHGFNLLKELSSKNVMITTRFEKSENNTLPTTITYRQIGLLVNPYSQENSQNIANSSFYTLTTNATVSPGLTDYSKGETLYQGVSLDNSTFSAKVLTFDSANNFLYLINTTGTPATNYNLIGSDSGSSRILLQVNDPIVAPFSGTIFYLENRKNIYRSYQGSEQIRILLKY